MNDLQRVGGIAALIEASTFVIGLVLYFTVLASAGYGSADIDPIRHVAFLAEHETLMYAWNLIIYVVFGIVLVILALALHQRLMAGAPAITQTATVFGLIWAVLVIASGMIANVGTGVVVDLYARDPAQAASVWLTLKFVVGGLGGGNEIVGGLWVVLVSWAALKAGTLPKGLNYLGLVVGLAGLLTAVPPLGEFGTLFGLGSIAWFLGLAIVLLRTIGRQAVPGTNALRD